MNTTLNQKRRACVAIPSLIFISAAVLTAPANLPAQTLYVRAGGQAIDKINSLGQVTPFATLPANSDAQGLVFTGGNLYVADHGTDQISLINSSGTTSLFASLPVNSGPVGLGLNSISGNLFSADLSSGQISKITPMGSVSDFSDASQPFGVAVDSHGSVFFTTYDASGHIYEIGSEGGPPTLFATVTPGSGPEGLAFDSSDNLYVADRNADQISKITPGGMVSLFATLANATGPTGLVFDQEGNLYSSNANATIDRISADGMVVTFASGLNDPTFIAISDVPEPSTWAMGALGLVSVLLLGKRSVTRADGARHRAHSRPNNT